MSSPQHDRSGSGSPVASPSSSAGTAGMHFTVDGWDPTYGTSRRLGDARPLYRALRVAAT